MKDFFISYNGKDKEWAEWIAWQLEEAGYTTIIQSWDFRPGGNFVINMQKAAEEAKRTIAILSQNYLDAMYTQPEWAAAFAQDPSGTQKTLVPVRIQECTLKGMLSQIVYIDLVGKAESEARELLLTGLQMGRAKPTVAPSFPQESGSISQASKPKPAFPAELEVRLQLRQGRPDEEWRRLYFDVAVSSTNSISSEYGALKLTVANPIKLDKIMQVGSFRSGQFEWSTSLQLDGAERHPSGMSMKIRWGADKGNIVFPGDWYDFYNNSISLYVPELSLIAKPTYLFLVELFTTNRQSKKQFYSIQRKSSSNEFEIVRVNTSNYDGVIASFWKTYNEANQKQLSRTFKG